MKKPLHLSAIILIPVFAFIFNGCEKDDPATSTSVTSHTFNATSWAWSSPHYYVNFSVPEITSSNLNSVAVMTYFSSSPGVWQGMPYTQYESPYNYYMGFNTSVGRVKVTWFYDSSLSSGNNPNVYYGTTVQCKVVVIPQEAIIAYPDLDLKNYEAVKKAFNLSEK